MSVMSEFLKAEREKAGLTVTEVADRMHWPRGAVSAIERGKRKPYVSTVYKYISAVLGEDVNYGDMYNRFRKLPTEITLNDIRSWLESLDPDDVVYGEGLASHSCVVTQYGKRALNLPNAVSNYRSLHDGTYSIDTFYHILVADDVGNAMMKFDDTRKTLTAREALAIIDGK